MGKITILEETTKNPITLIGKRAGICYGSDITDDNKNYIRGIGCITDRHGRTLEYPNVEMIIDGYSAKTIREWYTHIGCLPTRLQSSTRYINYKNFDFVVPKTVKNCKDDDAFYYYMKAIKQIRNSINALIDIGVPNEDATMLLPICMKTKMVDKRNLRNLIDMSKNRECTRAYWEFREMFNDIKNALREYSDEWKWIVDNLFMPKCEGLGYCPERKSCGRKKPKEES